MQDGDSRRSTPPRTVQHARPMWFLLARPTPDLDTMPSTIGERDVFFSEEAALDALDIHYAWCITDHGPSVAESAQWYLQSAMGGPRVNPGLGDVYLALTDTNSGETWAAAGGFLTEGEVVHWAPFVSSVRPYIRIAAGDDPLELAYRGDTSVHFGHVWFAPMHSVRVYPKRIDVGDDATG